MTQQQQRYDTVGMIGSYELRSYHPCVVADVTVEGPFEKAGNAGFRPLINYIGGANHSSSKVAMTAPVIQESSRKMHVDEPALESTHGNSHVISFVMPAQYSSVAELPIPKNSQVVLRAIPAQLVAVDRFSGRWTEAIYADRLTSLRSCLEIHGYVPVGAARFARFDPPWTPWFMRRNEIQLPIAEKP